MAGAILITFTHMRISKPSSETFGTGSFVGDIMDDETFFDMPAEDQARFLGQRAGCPVVEELIHPDTGRGPEAMAHRYTQVNFWYGFIRREIDHYDKPLFEKFSKVTPRKEGESVGKYEPESVPENYTEIMTPINSLPGFSLSRMMMEQIEAGENRDERQQRLVTGLRVIERAIKKSKTPLELMARVAQGLAEDGVNYDKIIKLILGQGWMDEHNAKTMLGEGKDALKEFAPVMWEYYEKLTPEEREEKGLVV